MLTPPSATPPPRFRSGFTIFCGALLLFGFGFLILISLFFSPIHGVRSPERALSLLAGRTMEFRSALPRVPGWERAFYRFWDPALGSDREVEDLVDWHRELAHLFQDTTAVAAILILQAEQGRLEEVREQTDRWVESSPGNLPHLSRLVRQAYLQSGAPQEPEVQLALTRELLPPGWVRNRLEERLAQKAGLPDPVAGAQKEGAQRGMRLLWRYRALTVLDLTMLLLCTAAAVLFLTHRHLLWKAGPASLPPRWDWGTGMTVVIRGLGLGILLGLAVAFMLELPDWADAMLTYLFWTLPLLFLARRHLFLPQGLRLRQELGLSPPAGSWKKLLALALVACAADELGSWAIFLGGTFFRWPYHWAESFEENLIWAGPLTAGATVASLAFIAPLFEELIFRGFLYGTLRKKLSWLPAALATAFLFSLAHGYSMLGFTTILWSGLVLAWVYERSGSLLPAVAVHTFGNFMFSVTQMAMFRLP